MDRKKQLEAMEPSSSEEESGVDSSDEEDDEFDSEDERVKQVPLHPPADFFTQEDEEAGSSSSDDSDSDSESVENTHKNTAQESEVGDYVTSSDDDDDDDDDEDEEEDDDEDSGESENESEETQEFNTATVNTKSRTQKDTEGKLAKDGSINLQNNSISVEMKGKVEDQHSVRKTTKTEALKLQNNEKEVDKPNRNGNGNGNKKDQELKSEKPGNEEQGNQSAIRNGKSVNGSNEDQGNRSTMKSGKSVNGSNEDQGNRLTMKNGKSTNSSGTNEEEQAYKLALVTKDSQQKSEQRSTQIQKKEKEVKSSNKDDKDTKANNGELGKRTREEEPSDSEATTNTAAAQKKKMKKKEDSSTVESLAKDDGVAVMQKKQQSVVDESSDRETATKKKKNKKEQSSATMDVEQSLQNGDMKSAHNKTVKQDLKKGIAKKLLRTESTVTGNGSAVVVERKASVSKQESEMKQKRPHVWKFDEEAYFLQLILDHVNPGMESEENWLMILEKLSEHRSILSEKMHSKFGIELVKEQMYDKLRRMKKKFQSNGNKPFQCKNSNDQVLYDLWNQLLGNHTASYPKGQGEPDGDQYLKSNAKGGQNAKDSKKKQVLKANKSNSVKAKDRNNGDFTDDPEISKNVSEKPVNNMHTEMNVDRNEKASDMEIDKNRNSMDVDNGNSVVRSDRMNALVECNGHVKANMNKNMCPESFYINSSVLDVVQAEREAFICEYKEWLRQTLDGFTSKITSHVDDLKNQNQAIQVNNPGNGLTMSSLAGLDIRNVMDFQPSQHCDPSLKREWCELQMQELNIYSQRLKLMLSECELQKEKLKLQLQLDRRQG